MHCSIYTQSRHFPTFSSALIKIMKDKKCADATLNALFESKAIKFSSIVFYGGCQLEVFAVCYCSCP
jgi:hypothetical protein